MIDEIEVAKLEIGDRAGILLELQREEAALQASATGTPNVFALPYYYCRMELTSVMVSLPVRDKTVAIVLLDRG